jgi:pimeloyl-ACP methyl ester carboxylesterase
MPGKPMKDVVVLLPGITGSVLQKDGRDVWAFSGSAAINALRSLGRSVKDLALTDDPPDVDDLGDGVTAPRVMPDIHLIPGLWKIDGYGKVANAVREGFDVTEGQNFFEFAYDWRRDNRVAARKLARESHDWLKAWRERSGNDQAKLILVAHSMGGLISRHFLELLEGWKDTRMLITFGTPYRGSLNAVDFLANGLKKKLGPITLLDLSRLLQSFTSVYQLLPIYPCVDAGDGRPLGRVTEVAGLGSMDPAKAAAALAFHHDIADAVTSHRQDPDYVDHGYAIHPIVGMFQPTNQSARLAGGHVEILRTYQGEDQDGDGTVPRVSATPLELSNQDREVYIRERHGSLQNADHTLDQLSGVLSRQVVDQTRFFAPKPGVAMDVEDAYLSREVVGVRAMAEAEWATLTATVVDVDTEATVASANLAPGSDGWHQGHLGPFPQGAYRLTVGGQGVDPVTDLFAVFDEGTDLIE